MVNQVIPLFSNSKVPDYSVEDGRNGRKYPEEASDESSSVENVPQPDLTAQQASPQNDGEITKTEKNLPAAFITSKHPLCKIPLDISGHAPLFFPKQRDFLLQRSIGQTLTHGSDRRVIIFWAENFSNPNIRVRNLKMIHMFGILINFVTIVTTYSQQLH